MANLFPIQFSKALCSLHEWMISELYICDKIMQLVLVRLGNGEDSNNQSMSLLKGLCKWMKNITLRITQLIQKIPKQ